MDEEGAWVVRLAGIRQAIDLLLMEELGVSSLARGVEADTLGDTVLLRLNGAPLARLTVSCHPAEAASRTTLTCTPYYPPDLPGVDCGKARQTREENGSPAAREWRMQLRAGVYTLSAKSATTEISRPHHVCPPHSRARFEVAP
jgi:ribosomal protein L32